MQFSRKLFLMMIPLLLSAKVYPTEPTHSKNKQDTIIEINDDNNLNNSVCRLCCWLGTQEKNDLLEAEPLVKQDEDDNSTKATMQCQLLRSLFCRCKEKEHDLEQGPLALEDAEKKTHAFDSYVDRKKLKTFSVYALEIALKMGFIQAVSHSHLGQQAIFFAEHHTAEAMGKHIKFDTPYRLPKYVAASALVLALGFGIAYLEAYRIVRLDFDLHAAPLTTLTVFKLINNYFDQLNHDENREH